MNNKKTIHKKEIYKEIQKRLDAKMHELIVPEASEEDIETQKEYNKELEKEIELKNQLKEKIAQKVKERLDFMGTADEETMKYLLQDIGREELVNFEKQFVAMFELLRDIRYDGSEQLSKGASEISQRIHNFITIFRQALKGNPVIKEETIDEGKTESLTNNHSNPVLEAAKKKLVSLINNIALKEGISKKEATIKAIKALQESK
jgi:hypothetical protein